ncbi:MAG: hypothetical protein WC373_00855 [Smithella sp.]|jgi:hypothetical protein
MMIEIPNELVGMLFYAFRPYAFKDESNEFKENAKKISKKIQEQYEEYLRIKGVIRDEYPMRTMRRSWYGGDRKLYRMQRERVLSGRAGGKL